MVGISAKEKTRPFPFMVPAAYRIGGRQEETPGEGMEGGWRYRQVEEQRVSKN